jgi:hypothetical protein
MVVLCPGAIVAAGTPAAAVKLAPETAVRSMVTVEVPVFVTVTLCVVDLPTPTVPKLTVVRLADSMPVPEPDVFDGVLALVRPVQLESPRIAIITASKIIKASGPAGRLAPDRASSTRE